MMLPGLMISLIVVLFSAYYVFLGGSLIAWKTKKQLVVSCLSVKAELHAMTLVTVEVNWL
jgi:hypothetical protein